jgi:hypothetical protein
MADLLAVFVKSFATPQMPCAPTTQINDTHTDHAGFITESISKPTICVASPTVSMRVIPKRVASQPPHKLAPIPAASYNKNKDAKANGV